MSEQRLREKLIELTQELDNGLEELKQDGVYRCCQGTYEHCSESIKRILQETAS